MDVELAQGSELTSPTDSQELSESSQSTSNNLSDRAAQAEAQAIAELDKMREFKFKGERYTPKDLEKAILRQKDYTQKTQSLSEERKTFEKEQKFYENLRYDLDFVRKNPTQQVINEFLKVYPEKFHGHLKSLIQELQTNLNANSQTQGQQQKPQYDVETMSRLQKLETFYNEQEVAKNTAQINSMIDKFSKQYPDAIARLAIADVFEAYNQNPKMQLGEKDWENAFKAVDAQMKQLVKAKYGDLVKKQTSANKKARDVSPGGGTVGRAPVKPKTFAEATKHALDDLGRKG